MLITTPSVSEAKVVSRGAMTNCRRKPASNAPTGSMSTPSASRIVLTRGRSRMSRSNG